MSAAILASKNRIAPCQSMVLFLDKKMLIFLSQRDTPPCLRHAKKSIGNILGGCAAGPHSAAQ